MVYYFLLPELAGKELLFIASVIVLVSLIIWRISLVRQGIKRK